jgi:hypothetical protein
MVMTDIRLIKNPALAGLLILFIYDAVIAHLSQLKDLNEYSP